MRGAAGVTLREPGGRSPATPVDSVGEGLKAGAGADVAGAVVGVLGSEVDVAVLVGVVAAGGVDTGVGLGVGVVMTLGLPHTAHNPARLTLVKPAVAVCPAAVTVNCVEVGPAGTKPLFESGFSETVNVHGGRSENVALPSAPVRNV